MFSTLGMIRGAENRLLALKHLFRILKPNARLVLHVHNHWFHLFDPGGIRWVIADLFRVIANKSLDLGDKYSDYRGIPRVYLHSFRRREFRDVLISSGFEILRWQPLNSDQSKPLPCPKFLETIRASGWLVVVRKPLVSAP